MCHKIVTLTSYGLRLNGTLPKTLESVYANMTPDAVVLYVSGNDKYVKRLDESAFRDFPNLDIRYVEHDCRSHNKYTALTERGFDDDFVWVIDDDLIYDADCWRTFESAFQEHGSSCVYAFGMRRVGFPFLEQDFFTETRVYHYGFVVYSGWGLVFPPNLMRLERSDIDEAFRVSPTCDDTYLSPYMISHGIGVCNLSGVRKNQKQRLPIGCNTLFNFNRTKYDRHIRDNFARFGLTV